MARKFFALLCLSTTLLCFLGSIWLAIESGTFNPKELAGSSFIIGIALVGCFILVRRPENRLGWLFCWIGLLWVGSGTMLAYVEYALIAGIDSNGLSWVALAADTIFDLCWVTSFTFLFLLFPDGQLPSPRWRIPARLIAALILVLLFLNLVSPGPLNEIPSINNPLGGTRLGSLAVLGSIIEPLLLVSLLTCLSSIFIRFRHAGPLVKRQIKWLAYIGLLIGAVFLFQFLFSSYLDEWMLWGVMDAISTFIITAFPLVIGIAILRYQLFDIDILIRRTIQYTLITGTLALLYIGSVTLLQALFTMFGGAQSSLVTVISTLMIAAVFTPLRRRVQEVVDRRFYRRKYNAEQALAQFALIARNEVDLNRLTGALLEVIEETMAPESLQIVLYPARQSPIS